MGWIDHARKYLALNDLDELANARDEVDDAEIRAFVEELMKIKGYVKDFQPGSELAKRLKEDGKDIEADVITLLLLNKAASMFVTPVRFPNPNEGNVLEMSLGACRMCIELTEIHGFREIEARFLSIIGTVLADNFRWNEAKQAYSEALMIRRELAEAEPRIYEFYLATTLHNMANMFVKLRAFTEANQALSEALEINRKLVPSDPLEFKPYLAVTLGSLGGVLSYQGVFTKAKQLYSEALVIYRELAEAKHSVFKPYVATTLINLGAVLRDLRLIDDAGQAFNEGLKIYRKLAEVEPHIYKPYVGTALYNLGILLDDQCAYGEARQAYSEALEIRRELAEAEPHIYKPDVAGVATNLGLTFEELGMHNEAMAHFKEAVDACEDKSIPYNEVYLARGEVEPSYRGMIAHFAEQNDADSLFNHIVALREPNRMPPGGALEIAVHEIAATGDKLGNRSIKVLIVEKLRYETFLGVFGWSNNEPLKWEVVPGLAEKGNAFGKKYWKWQKHIFALIKKAREGDDERVKNIEAAIPAAIDEMKSAAARVWDALPEWIKDFLKQGTDYEICISATSWTTFPFEMLRFGEGEDDYIGLHRALPRIHGLSAGYWAGLTDRLLGGGNKNLLLYANPTSDLQDCGAEAKAIEDHLKGHYKIIKRLKNDATDENLAGDLQEPFSIFHYTGHGSIVGAGSYNPNDSRSSLTGEEVLILHEGMPFGAPYIKYFRFDTHPLIVLNSCLTGKSRLYGGIREDLAGAFLRQGAESVIASVIPVGTEIGKIFGDQLYRQDEAEIQTAFLNARKETEKIAREYHSLFWPCWAFFALHGNPYARLPHVKS